MRVVRDMRASHQQDILTNHCFARKALMDLHEFSYTCTIFDTYADGSAGRVEAARVRAAMLRRPTHDSVRPDIHVVPDR
jgi:hypothetical protein